MLKWLWMVGALLLTGCADKADESLSLVFTGDVLFDRGVRQQITATGVDELFSDVAAEFHAADAAIVNLECPITSVAQPVHKRYIFRGDTCCAAALARAGVTHAALANNHSIDQGRNGLSETMQLLAKAGISPMGAGENPEAAGRPVVIRKGNIEVACFNSVLLPLENWLYLEEKPDVCRWTVGRLAEEIRMYKAAHPHNKVVVVLHWGMEYHKTPSPMQRRDAWRLIRAGADAIVGHHPHVIQQLEYIEGKPVAYSLGNFVFDQRTPDTSSAQMLRLTFTNDSCRCDIIPVTIVNCRPKGENFSPNRG